MADTAVIEEKEEEPKAKDKGQSDRVDYCLKQIKSVRDNMGAMEEHRVNAIKFYRGDPDILEYEENQPTITSRDLFEAVEWMMPSFIRIFASSDKVVKLVPRTKEDVDPVKNLELLVNYQMRIRNRWYHIISDWIRDSLLCQVGVVKFQWVREKKYGPEQPYRGLNEYEYQALAAHPNLEITDETAQEVELSAEVRDEQGTVLSPAVTGTVYDITIQPVEIDEYPLIEPIPLEDCGWPKDTRDIRKARFTYHRFTMTAVEFKQRYGEDLYEQVEDAKNLFETQDSVTDERYRDLGGVDFLYNKDREELVLYECCFYDQETGKPRLMTLCGDVPVVDEPNKYGGTTLRTITPIRRPHNVIGYDMYDTLREIQLTFTLLKRQIHKNLLEANSRRYFVWDDMLNMEDYKNDDPTNAIIRTYGPPADVVAPEKKAGLPQETFSYMEMMYQERDYLTGVPRSFQGTNDKILNETWRGQNQQVNQAGQRIELMARQFAEDIALLIEDVIDMNLKFLSRDMMIRVTNTDKLINKDNINGKYDLTVNVGIGAGDKQQIIAYMQQLFQIQAQAYKAGLPIVSARTGYHIGSELTQAMGFVDTENFWEDPEEQKTMVDLIKSVMAHMQKMGMPDPQLMGPLQKAMAIYGMRPEQFQNMSGRTAPGQTMPAPPAGARLPMNPFMGGNDGMGGVA